MAHRAPRVLEICAIQRSARLAGLEAGGSSGHLEVDKRPLIVHALDCVRVTVLGELDSAVIGVEGRLVLVEGDVA